MCRVLWAVHSDGEVFTPQRLRAVKGEGPGGSRAGRSSGEASGVPAEVRGVGRPGRKWPDPAAVPWPSSPLAGGFPTKGAASISRGRSPECCTCVLPANRAPWG